MRTLVLLGVVLVAESADPVPMIGYTCPSGYQQSAGNWCVPNRTSSRPAIPRLDHRCPAGWRQSGMAYCVKN